MRFVKAIGRPSIGFVMAGCRNRPFYYICVLPDRIMGRHYRGNAIEQIGSFDPLPNSRGEKLVALDIGRLKYWIGIHDVNISVPVLELLGLSGLFPIHPKTYIRARDNRNAGFKAKEKSEEDCGESDVGDSATDSSSSLKFNESISS